MPQQPDIVLFMLDQLSARWIEDPASRCVPTPNIDRLRSSGVTFTRTCTSNPVCMPARSTLATGLTTRQHGVLQNGYSLDPELPTFMRLLQQSGRRTGAFGKVHLHPHFAGVHPDYSPYGFDETHITEDPRAGDWLDWIRAEHPEHEEAALATIWCSDVPELQRYGPDQEDLSSRIKRIRSEFDWTTPEFPENTPGHYTLPFPEEISQTAWITRHALDFIRSTDPDDPLFAQVSYVQPHSPSCPPAEYMDRVDTSRIPEPAPVEWSGEPPPPPRFHPARAAPPPRPPKRGGRPREFFAHLAHLDEQLGRLIDTLQETGRWDNTCLILLSDHGELLQDHGLRGKGEFHYDACIRVPLIIAGPGLDAGTERDEFAQLEDIFPTVLEMAGLPLPAPPVEGPYMQETPQRYPGRSLLPLCRGETPGNWRDCAYVESYNNINSATPANWARTIVTKNYRYTLYPNESGEQLFDLTEDPQEQRNLAASSTHQTTRRTLQRRLLDKIILQDFPHPTRELYAHGVH